MKDGLKLIKAEVNNFKNITQKVIEFNGKSALIIGKNGAGKSSLIQAITSPINPKSVPQQSIKQGEEKASVILTVAGSLNGEDQQYNIEMYFSEKNKKGSISLFDEDGGKIPGSKGMVESIVGNIGFDILDFIDLGLTKDGKVSKPGVREQIETLMGFMPADVQKELHQLDIEKAEAYAYRTDINRELKSNQAKLEGMEMDPADIEKYSEKMDDTDVKARMSKIGEEMSTYDRIAGGVETKMSKAVAIESEIIRLEGLVGDLKKEGADIVADIEKGNKWLEGKERPSMEALSKDLLEIEHHNDKHRKVVECMQFDKNARDFKAKADELTARYEEIDVEKSKLFTENPLPVKDLTFTEEEILYKGLPFNANQHPSSTIIGVGTKIAMAMNPNLRLLIIKDGSLLDKKVLKFILGMVEKEGYQIFIEMVDYEGEKDLTVEFVESEVK